MPVYAYRCPHCTHEHSAIRDICSWSEDKEVCPVCDKPTKRIVVRSSFILKGGGWADDGYSSSTTK